MKRLLPVTIITSIALVGCVSTGKDDARDIQTPKPTPFQTISVVGNVGTDWEIETRQYPWYRKVIEANWIQRTPWLQITITDGTSLDDAIDICRTGIKFFKDHTSGVGGEVWIFDSRGRFVESNNGYCDRVS